MKTLLLTILILTLHFNTYSFNSNNRQTVDDYKIINDSMLLNTARDNGLVPDNASLEYMQEQIKAENTIILWILFNKRKKIEIIDILRSKYKEDENAVILLIMSMRSTVLFIRAY